MSDKSSIEWTDATWNPTTGCTKVSPGCDHCYAERIVNRFKGKGAFDTVTRSEEKLYAPMRWRRPRRVFVNSMSDLFHEDVPDGFIARVWNVMAHCPEHTFQILTKRHARMRSWVTRWSDTTGDDQVGDPGRLPPMPRGPGPVRATYTSGRAQLFADMLDDLGDPPEGAAYPLYDWMEGQRWWPEVLPNVWLGVSVEDQHWADIRIPALLETPAAVRWVSAEPLLGPVTLREDWIELELPAFGGNGAACFPRVDWLVLGGESGPAARPMHPDWARSLRDQCTGASVPFFFKQWGGWAPTTGPGWYSRTQWVESPGGRPAHMYAPRSKDLRELDGRTWDEYPTAGVVRSDV